MPCKSRAERTIESHMIRRILIHLFVLFCLPWVTYWAWRRERHILCVGRPLTPDESDRAATRAGVAAPSRIRVLTVPSVPLPGWRWMRALAARMGFDGSATSGMSLRYGIFLRSDCASDPALLLHECAHTAQYERMGSLAAFMREYLVQCLRDGYADSALEREASAVAAEEQVEGV
jgi:hypothetical protein